MGAHNFVFYATLRNEGFYFLTALSLSFGDSCNLAFPQLFLTPLGFKILITPQLEVSASSRQSSIGKRISDNVCQCDGWLLNTGCAWPELQVSLFQEKACASSHMSSPKDNRSHYVKAAMPVGLASFSTLNTFQKKKYP